MIDTHIHLQDIAFDIDRQSVIAKAKNAGIKSFICVSTDIESSIKAIELQKLHSEIIPFIGIHPYYSDNYNEQELKSLLEQNPLAGIGEIGLDSIKGQSNQEDVFINQLNLAYVYKRPCIIHCVKAFHRLAHILKNTKDLPASILIHSFNGNEQDMRFLMNYNVYFSFSGKALFPNKTKLQDLIKSVPKDRILVETDAPYQMPPSDFVIDKNEKRNLPENLFLIINEIARIRNTDEQNFIQELEQNAQHFLTGI